MCHAVTRFPMKKYIFFSLFFFESTENMTDKLLGLYEEVMLMSPIRDKEQDRNQT